MPNGRTHKVVGGITGTATAAVLAKNERGLDFALEVLGGGGVGVLGGRLPDFLEPALHPCHRAFYHSVVAVGATTAAVGKWLCAVQDRVRLEASDQRVLMRETHGFEAFLHGFFWVVLRLLAGAVAGAVAGLATGFLSHLVLDMGTPMSLPLLGIEIT